MADVCVSVVLKRLAPSIEDGIRKEITLLLNADKEAQSLSQKLKKIHLVLADAERKGVEDPSVKSWLDKLQSISYDIDDALDEWELQNIRQKLQDDHAHNSDHHTDSWEKKVCSFLQSVCLCFKQTVHRRTIALDVKDIHERLDRIAQENENEFNFIPNLGRAADSKKFKSNPSKSFVDVSKIHGRDDDKKTLLAKLLSKSSSSGLGDDAHVDGVPIISIVGVGGMGKTALAQLVFNDDQVKNQFKLKIWVCVSDPFDEIKIAKAILEDTDRASSSLSEPQTLLKAVEKSISGQKFLLVLDDVWEEDDSKWESLKECLKSGDPGSRILVTTRKTRVAEIMGITYMHTLEPLPDSYCWSVLSQLAFQGRGETDREMLKETGLEIAKKCKGLPLAAKTIGGLLRFKTSLQEWQEILDSKMWELEKVRKDLFPLLTLSYNELHPAMKRCFSFCAIFPKDELINVDKLIRMWMAQGFLFSSGSSGRELERTGRDYFDDLAMRSFFQDFQKDKTGNNIIINCKMHDIVHDFAQFLTRNECLVLENVEGGTQVVPSENTRHMNLLLPKGNADFGPFSIWQAEQLRSCFCSRNEIPLDLFIRLKRVRLLSLHACRLKDIPKEIGNLIHLRYLDVSSNTQIKELPETIYDLHYLQTLNVQLCTSLGGLPAQGIHKLINLRHLLNSEASFRSFRLPQGFEKLTNLRTLSEFNASASGNNLGLLKGFNQLGGSLFIRLCSDFDELEAKEADLASKKSIQTLRLEVGAARTETIEALQPHSNLPILVFWGGKHLPKWISTLTNLRKLTVNGLMPKRSKATDYWLPLAKLPLLEDLDVIGCGIERVGHEFLGINEMTPSASSCGSIFPKLKTLSFKICLLWTVWEDISEEQAINVTTSILPCLQELHLNECSELRSLPHRLLNKATSLRHLTVHNCGFLQSRYNEETGADRIQLSHIPRVEFSSRKSIFSNGGLFLRSR